MELLSPPRPSGATTVVKTLTEAALQAAITRGGKVFVQGSGTLSIATGITLPDKDVSVEFDPRITVSLGSNAITLFTTGAALTAVRLYTFRGLTLIGDKTVAQKVFNHADVNGRGWSKWENCQLGGSNAAGTAIKTIFDVTAYDVSVSEPLYIVLDNCDVAAPNVANATLIQTPNAGGSFLGIVQFHAVNCRFTGDKWNEGVIGSSFGWLVNLDGDMRMTATTIRFSSASKMGALALQDCYVIMPDGDVTAYGPDWNGEPSIVNSEFTGTTANARLIAEGIMRLANCLFANCALKFAVVRAAAVNCTFNSTLIVTQLEITDPNCSVLGCFFNGATGRAIYLNGATGCQIGPNVFTMAGAVATVEEAGAADSNTISGNGLGTGGGIVRLGTSTRIDGVQAGNATGAASVAFGYGRLHASYSDVGNVGGGTDDLHTYAMPAKVLNETGRSLYIKAWGRTANNANAKTVTLNFGGQVIMTQALTISIAGTWVIEARIGKTGASTQRIFAELKQLATSLEKHTSTAGTQTDTAAITIKCTGAATADNDIVQEGMIVEVS